MADDVREFSKDNAPNPNEGAWYRSKEMVFASGPHTDVKVGGKRHKDTGFVVDSHPLENKQSNLKWISADDFNEKFAPAAASDIPRSQGPHFDAHEASEEQANSYQFDPNVEGDRDAEQQLQNPNS